MFAVKCLSGFAPCFFQRRKSADLYIKPDWIGSLEWRWQSVASEIKLLTDHCLHYIVNQRGVHDGTICGDADNHIRFGSLRGLIVAVEHVKETAARERDSAEVAVFGHGVIGE